MEASRTLILTAEQIQQKINRIAYQIYENNYSEKSIVIAGIANRGTILAERLANQLEVISPIKVIRAEVTLNKDNPLQDPILLSIPTKSLSGKVVVLVDDVLNSGKALLYGIEPFLKVQVKSIITVVLVDRNHNRYPIKADFVGLSLATTLQEHIAVELGKKGKDAVYLQ